MTEETKALANSLHEDRMAIKKALSDFSLRLSRMSGERAHVASRLAHASYTLIEEIEYYDLMLIAEQNQKEGTK